MTQKTEASQAVDEREQFEQWAKRRGHDIVSRIETGGKFYNSSFTTHLWATWQASRAALKAQPAPTEVAQAGAGLTRENPQTRMGSTFDAGAGLAAQGDAIKARVQELQKQGLPLHDDVVLQQLSGNSGELQPSGNTGELAQGEDSARLDALHDQMVDTIYMDDGRVIDVGGKHLNDLRKAIDAFLARASAETGGVKS